jgi:hypothetical protein
MPAVRSRDPFLRMLRVGQVQARLGLTRINVLGDTALRCLWE